MAIEMANVLRSLNSMLDSKEQRQRFDVQAALSGMEIAMKREQQRIGEKQFKEELSLKRRGMELQEEELGLAKEDQFMKQIATLNIMVTNEQMKAATGTWTSYFSGIHDNYFRKGVYDESSRKKLRRDLKKEIGDEGLARRITNIIAEYGSGLTADGKGNSSLMLRMADIVVDKSNTDPRFAKGMMRFMGISDDYDSAVFQKDFDDLRQYEIMSSKLEKEEFDITKGDFEFDGGLLADIEGARTENERGEEEFNYVRVGSQTINRQDIVDYANENEISYKEAKDDIQGMQGSSRTSTGDERLDALRSIQTLAGEERMKAIANQLSLESTYGIREFDPEKGFVFEEGEAEFDLKLGGSRGDMFYVFDPTAAPDEQRKQIENADRALRSELYESKKSLDLLSRDVSQLERSKNLGYNVEPEYESGLKIEQELLKLQIDALNYQTKKMGDDYLKIYGDMSPKEKRAEWTKKHGHRIHSNF